MKKIRDYINRTEQEKIDQLRSMKLDGQFGRDIYDKKSEKSWHWLINWNLKVETETLLSVAQEQALNTHSVRKNYDKNVSHKCRLCSAHSEWLQYVSTERVKEHTQ